MGKKKDPVKYRKLVNQFRKEMVIKSKDSPIQILDTAQNFSLWLDKNGYEIAPKMWKTEIPEDAEAEYRAMEAEHEAEEKARWEAEQEAQQQAEYEAEMEAQAQAEAQQEY